MTTDKRRRLNAASVLVAASLAFSFLLFWVLPNVFESWNLQTVDTLFHLRSSLRPPRYDSAIVHVDIDNSSIQKLSYYFPRRYYAEVINLLTQMDFRSVAFDIVFAQRINAYDDSLLLAAASASSRSFFPVAFSLEDEPKKSASPSKEISNFLDSTAWSIQAGNIQDFYQAGSTLLTWPELAGVSRGIGFISVRTDLDGVFRRVPLLIRYKNRFYPSMVMRMLCDRLGVTPDRIVVDGGGSITLKDVRAKEGKDIVIPIDRKGNMIINWIGDWNAMTHISFAQLLEVAQDREEVEVYATRFAGSMGIVGDVSTGVSDIGPTPFETSFPLVGLHANTLNTILTENFLRELPLTQMLILEALMFLILVWFSVTLASIRFTIASTALLVLHLAGAAVLFIYFNTIIAIIQPLLFIGFSISSVLAYRYIYEEKEKDRLRSRFESYFPPAIVKQMLENPDSLPTSPRKREVTIMFSDIKSFTTYSSTMTPEEISTTLNEYFGSMIEIVFKYGGTVDKFIGDGLMVFYGAPEPQPDHAVRCVRAAIEMQKKCREFKARWEPVGRLPLKIRIGINTGQVVVGDLGSSRRMEYTVLGSDVNLAQRLESNAPVEGIMISQRTYELVKDAVPTRPLEPIKVKGLETPIVVHEVLVG